VGSGVWGGEGEEDMMITASQMAAQRDEREQEEMEAATTAAATEMMATATAVERAGTGAEAIEEEVIFTESGIRLGEY
jgi:hypothetical protein